MFAATHRFKDAVELINNAEERKLPLLVSRIIERLHTKEKSFSDAEEEQLKRMFQLSSGELKTLLDACSFVFEQSAYYGATPSNLLDQLDQVGMSSSACMSFAKLWEDFGPKYIQSLQKKPFGCPKVLDNVDWKLNLRMSQDTKSELRDPTALFEFSLSDPNEKDNEIFQVEFSKERLYDFFNKLELIQDQLDSLQ